MTYRKGEKKKERAEKKRKRKTRKNAREAGSRRKKNLENRGTFLSCILALL